MSLTIFQSRFQVYDVRGRCIAPSFTATSEGDAYDIANAIQPYTYCPITSIIVAKSFAGPNGGDPTNPLSNIFDAAILTYRDSGTKAVARIAIPGPWDGMFLPDGEEVDPAAIVALNGVLLGKLCSPSGIAVDEYVGGVRRRFPPQIGRG